MRMEGGGAGRGGNLGLGIWDWGFQNRNAPNFKSQIPNPKSEIVDRRNRPRRRSFARRVSQRRKRHGGRSLQRGLPRPQLAARPRRAKPVPPAGADRFLLREIVVL